MFGTHLGFTTDFPSTPCPSEKIGGLKNFLKCQENFTWGQISLKIPSKPQNWLKFPWTTFAEHCKIHETSWQS